MAQEVELKLTLPPEALAMLRGHPALAQRAAGRARTTRLVSAYYDTPTQELRAAGVALRLRRDGKRWLQTVKDEGSASAGLHTRSEYEWSLTRPRLDARKLATTPWHANFAATAARLRPAFTTDFSRTAQPLAFDDGSRAMLCVDRGEIRAGRRKIALSEIEIELIEGSAERLYELALALISDLPLAIAHASKAERGYALTQPRPPQPVRARMLPLAPDAPAAVALAAVAGDCLTQIGGNAEAVARGLDSEFLHQLRVGVRRLRSLLKLVVALAPPERLSAVAEEVGWLAQALGPARDWDVFASEIVPEIVPHLHDPQRRRELRRLRGRISHMRRTHRATAREASASSRLQRLLLALGAFFAGLARGDPPGELAATTATAFSQATLAERERKLSKRGKRLKRATAAERHRVRIAAKKLRYAAEFFAPLYPGKRTESYLSALTKLQSSLGRLNDLATAERLLDELAPPGEIAAGIAHAAGMLRGWVARAQAPELEKLDAAWRKFVKRDPFWD